MAENQKPIPIALADWADWFCRNVKDPQDFRWIHMTEMADQLRSLYKQLDSQQHVMDTRLNKIIELENERNKLLEALRRIADTSANQSGTGAQWVHWVDQARDAIAKAGGVA